MSAQTVPVKEASVLSHERLFEGWLLVSDIDGTMVDSHKRLPPRNVQAVHRFMELGGKFTLATGRCPRSVDRIASQLDVNCPVVALNGAVLYEASEQKMLFSWHLPDTYPRAVRHVLDALPEVGVQLFTTTDILTVRPNAATDHLLQVEHVAETLLPPDCYPDNVHKVLFAGTAEQIRPFQRFFHPQDIPGMYGMYTEFCYYELLPQGVSKGSGLKKLAALCDIPLEHTVAIGDYYNDIALLDAAAFPMLSGSAPQDLHALARYVACPAENGAVADAIDYLEQYLRTGNV